MERESNYIEGKFQNVLRNIFQFDASDLDFGIYRILNYKRNQIEKFINEDLKNKVEEAFSKYKKEQKEEIDKEFEKIKKEIAKLLGEDAFTLSGELKEEFKNTPLGKEFLSLKDRKEEIENIEEIKRQVFIDLYNFFSRYYEEGDFIPQLRYSIKGHKYVIPYNGEEVKLYWANYDQYYIKTGLFFRDYTFKAGDYKVIFRVVSASQELGSNKEKKSRFFILSEEDPIQINNSTLIVRFQYRELENDDKVVEVYRKKFSKNKSSGTESDQKKGINQNKLNIIIEEEILNNVKESILNLALKKEYKKDKEGSSISLLLYHLNRFTAKNTRDFFIHKNLKKFLSEQLDYFIKSEVLDIEILEKEKLLDKHITRAKVVRDIGGIIIDFLSQIEEFQKRLWEKKKFVIKTEYVITTDRVPEDFYDEIWKNKEQKKEWQELGFEIPKNKEELKNKKLPVDTKYFSQEFKERLLENLTKNADLDDLLDGILIKSENWQALNLLLEKYKEKVQVVYIDPPYNTGSDEFLYKDRYQHSSWLTMMESRLSLAKELMKEDGVIFVSIGNNGNQHFESYKLGMIMTSLFPKRFGDLIWKKMGGKGNLSETDLTELHEYILCFGREKSFLYENIIKKKELEEYEKDENGNLVKWIPLSSTSQHTKYTRPN
ncbi:MAG: site-specific DNA-methyltransferase, partial [Candidatus Hydrothermales bacterium]